MLSFWSGLPSRQEKAQDYAESALLKCYLVWGDTQDGEETQLQWFLSHFRVCSGVKSLGHLIGGEGRCLLSSGDKGGGILRRCFREPEVSFI